MTNWPLAGRSKLDVTRLLDLVQTLYFPFKNIAQMADVGPSIGVKLGVVHRRVTLPSECLNERLRDRIG